MNSMFARTDRTYSYLIMAAAMFVYVAIILPLFPDSEGKGGPDYGYFMPQLLAGYFWFVNNGLFAVPWFTPGFCGGMPYFANMQGIYYSVPQVLTFIMPPGDAIRASLVLFAATGLVGSYVLFRRRFAASEWAAATGAILFLFNGLYLYRMMAGHLTFHAFMLAPIVAFAVMGEDKSSSPWRGRSLAETVIAGLAIAYMVYSGMVHVLPPMLLAIAAFIMIHALVFESSPWASLIRLVAATALAAILATSKLVAAAAFLHEFPREMLPLLSFDTVGHTIILLVKSLFFLPPFNDGADWTVNNVWFPDERVILPVHEFTYSVSAVPLVLIVSALPWGIRWVYRNLSDRNLIRKLILAAIIFFIAAIPIALNAYSPSWTGFLKNVPIIKNSSTLVRWFTLDMLIVIVTTVLILDRFSLIARFTRLVALVTLVIVAAHNLVVSRGYYHSTYYSINRYDFSLVDRAWQKPAASGRVTPVTTIEFATLNKVAPWSSQRDRNDAIARGGSQAMCYEPMFGHRLEEFPFKDLKAGPALMSTNGALNIKNPACMLFPDANQCRPGDPFGTSDIDRARNFTQYLPFVFAMPWYQKAANWITVMALLGSISFLLGAGIFQLRRARLN